MDRCGTNDLYSACVIAVSATSVAKHHLSYEIPLTGTIENISVTIKRTFKGLGMQTPHSTTNSLLYKRGFSYIHMYVFL